MNNIIFKNYNISVTNGELVGIIGPNGSGKTKFLKKLIGREPNSDIYLDSKCIMEYDLEYKKNNITCVLNDNIFNTNKPKFELRYYLNIIKNSEENERILKYFIDYFKLDDVLEKDLDILTVEDRMYIKILSLLIVNPRIFCIDDILTYLNNEKKNRIINYIKENDITLFCVTSNMDELMLFDKLLVINNYEKVLYDDTLIVLENEKVFNELGLKLPFIYDINNLLKNYELINETHLVSKELVELLWK